MLQRLLANLNKGNRSKEAASHKFEAVSRTVDFDEARMCAKRQIELFEHWSRRLIDERLRDKFGIDYINARNRNGDYLIKTELRNRIQSRKQDDPRRFPRDIDAIVLEDIEYFFTKEEFYRECFKTVLEPFYSGREEIRNIMSRIIAIRNKLSHDNHISIREVEQALCYTNDFIDVFKDYYTNLGKEKEFNVPTLLTISDSLGNRVCRKQPLYTWEIRSVENNELLTAYRDSPYLDAISSSFRSGDRYEIELEVDGSFSSTSYTLAWELIVGNKAVLSGTGSRISICFTDSMVSYVPELHITLTTHKPWHRFANNGCDDEAIITLAKVLPPIEDSY